MKKTLILTAAIMATLSSCSRENSCNDSPSSKTLIHLTATGNGLKSGTLAGSEAESAVSSVSFFVFNADGSLDASTTVNSGSTTMTVTQGEGKTVCAAVNSRTDLVAGCASLSDLESAIDASLAAEGGTSSFTMAGRLDNVTIEASTAAIEIPVNRLAAKICIGKITNNLNASLGNISVTRIFLANATASAYWLKDDLTGEWMQKQGTDLSGLSWLCTTSGASIANGQSENTASEAFYCYPNPTTIDSREEQWCPRHTRLVVETVIGGKTWFYPISINASVEGNRIERNHIYKISELKINHLGSEDPDTPVSTGDITFSITVNPWEVVEIGDVAI